MVHHTREDALSDREYERLVAATHTLDDGYHALETRLVVLVAGRLGLRAGEIAHMRDSWIDRRNRMIRIPAQQDCTKGRDGGRCGYCRRQAEQVVEYADTDGDAEEQAVYEHALESMWNPKTDAAARDVPYDSDTRAALTIEEYFERFSEFQSSRVSVNRRVTAAAEAAPELDADEIYPHCLRSTAAEHLVARGLDVVALKQMFGWASFSTAECYIAGSGKATARKLRQLPG
ncbi:tyrosine-type recombinase/integrase [Halobaculum sp. EA56]|uniref:tyrosine-type recombinase/integrase n=1 Tax=Halobaculum sp. EA56 TaxID=3421648 RepID=UPI003EBAAF2B